MPVSEKAQQSQETFKTNSAGPIKHLGCYCWRYCILFTFGE